ncbi:MAG: hypothetical protein AAFP90_16160, partial [Planctomycetota bacterium]
MLIAIVVVTYLGSFQGIFVFDDFSAIVDNPEIKTFDLRVLISTYGPNRATVAILNYANYQISGENPFGYHIVNLMIHIAAALLVQQLVADLLLIWYSRRLQIPLHGVSGPGRNRSTEKKSEDASPHLVLNLQTVERVAFFSALLFAVHPIQTSAVTYITQRMESLAACFALLSLVTFVWSCRSIYPGRYRTLSILSLLAALFTKEYVVTLPAITLILDRVYLSDSWSEVRRL